MRTIAVVAILLLGISSAWSEPEHASMAPGSLVSSPVAAVPPVQTMEPSPLSAASAPPAPSGPASPAPATNAGSAPTPTAAQAQSTPAPSLDQVCNTLFTSAQDNDLPVSFFANLIWQESRLRNNAVSPKGAVGIAQFMPKVAAKFGVENPFDPAQALPASAKLLRELFDQFGNLGYVAAAYNAGTQRVLDWLERGRSLPRETRGYVMNITGRSVEAWRKTPADDALRFSRRLPCRGLPAFAELEQAQAKQAELERKQVEQVQAKQAELERKQAEQARAQVATQQVITPRQKTASREKTASRQKAASREKTASIVVYSDRHRSQVDRRQKRSKRQLAKAPAGKLSEKRGRLAKDDRSRKTIRREAVRTAKRERPRIKREAKEHIRHTQRERHQRA